MAYRFNPLNLKTWKSVLHLGCKFGYYDIGLYNYSYTGELIVFKLAPFIYIPHIEAFIIKTSIARHKPIV